MQVKGKVIIITGASQGIGEATAKLLASKGAKVVLAARSLDRLKELESELPDSLAVQTDMRKSQEIKSLVESALKKYGRIDILINNAGRGMWKLVEKTDIEEYKDLMDLNVYGYLRAMQAVIPIMREQHGGMIVNVSSMVSKNYIPNLAVYASTKYALNALTLTARQELSADGIVVSLIRPKITATNFGKNSLNTEPDAVRDAHSPVFRGMDSAAFVAEKIEELILSEQAELDL